MDNLKKLFFILIIVIILIGLLVTIVILRGINTTSSRASGPGQISLDNSYIFASPLSACADGLSRVRLTVFLLNTQGFGVSAQKVQLNLATDLTLEKGQDVTDSFGKSYFDISSTKAGDFPISADADGKKLPQQINVTFQPSSSCASR